MVLISSIWTHQLIGWRYTPSVAEVYVCSHLRRNMTTGQKWQDWFFFIVHLAYIFYFWYFCGQFSPLYISGKNAFTKMSSQLVRLIKAAAGIVVAYMAGWLLLLCLEFFPPSEAGKKGGVNLDSRVLQRTQSFGCKFKNTPIVVAHGRHLMLVCECACVVLYSLLMIIFVILLCKHQPTPVCHHVSNCYVLVRFWYPARLEDKFIQLSQVMGPQHAVFLCVCVSFLTIVCFALHDQCNPSATKVQRSLVIKLLTRFSYAVFGWF